MKTPQQAAANWAGSSARAQTAWTAGVEGFTGDWAGATTRQQAVMLQNLTTAITQGRWAAGVNKTGTQGWKNATTSKAANFATGFNAGAQKQATAIAKILQAEQSIVASLPPRGDFNANVQRSVSVQTQLHALKGTLGA